MKLGFVIYRYFPYGGQQRNMLAMATEALARGHQVCVACHHWQGDRPEGLEVIQVPVKGIANHTRMAVFGEAAQRALRDRHVDLVVGFIKLPGLDVYYAADPCFAEKAFHKRGLFYRFLPRTRGYLALESAVFAAGGKTHILEVSARERESFIRHYQTPEHRFHRLIPGISTTRLAPADYQAVGHKKRQELGLGAEDLVLLALGSGFKTKGLDRSIRTLAELRRRRKPAELVVVGQDKAASFRKLAHNEGVADHVHFLGGRDDIPELLQAANVLVHPAYRENTGNALLEAMIAGVPVIATETCGYSHYIIEADMGVVVGNDVNGAEIASAVEALAMTSSAEWHRRGSAFAAAADIYNRPAQCVNILESLVDEARARGDSR